MLAAAMLGLMAATAAPARAETIVQFSYLGRGGPDNSGLIATGNGRFSFADGLSTVGLSDLTSFDLTMVETTPNTIKFGLSDLDSFSASLGPGPTLTSLALTTAWVQGDSIGSQPRDFVVSSMGPDGAATNYELLGISFSWTTGAVTITSVDPVPEPSAGILAMLGALTVAAGYSGLRSARRRQ
jgi:hypothetical protein